MVIVGSVSEELAALELGEGFTDHVIILVVANGFSCPRVDLIFKIYSRREKDHSLVASRPNTARIQLTYKIPSNSDRHCRCAEC
jgi:hypothetical protein